jgi:hypothetical protein
VTRTETRSARGAHLIARFADIAGHVKTESADQQQGSARPEGAITVAAMIGLFACAHGQNPILAQAKHGSVQEALKAPLKVSASPGAGEVEPEQVLTIATAPYFAPQARGARKGVRFRRNF